MKTKICTKCGTELPATLEYWHKHQGCKYGLKGYCKQCALEQKQVYYIKNIEKIKSYRSTEEFKKNRSKHRRNKYATDDEYRLSQKKAKKEWYLKNKEREKERRSTDEFKETRREYNIKYIKKNKKRLYQNYKKWMQNNKEHVKKYNNERYALYNYSNVASYIKNNWNLKEIEIPPEIIETKRLILKLKRELKNENYGT